jgi:hypothetical protein
MVIESPEVSVTVRKLDRLQTVVPRRASARLFVTLGMHSLFIITSSKADPRMGRFIHSLSVQTGLLRQREQRDFMGLLPITHSLTKLSQSWGVHLETPILN